VSAVLHEITGNGSAFKATAGDALYFPACRYNGESMSSQLVLSMWHKHVQLHAQAAACELSPQVNPHAYLHVKVTWYHPRVLHAAGHVPVGGPAQKCT
jgi:hypothetical protein